jgi:hypothetical protein
MIVVWRRAHSQYEWRIKGRNVILELGGITLEHNLGLFVRLKFSFVSLLGKQIEELHSKSHRRSKSL